MPNGEEREMLVLFGFNLERKENFLSIGYWK
jgi:hypothetical protein